MQNVPKDIWTHILSYCKLESWYNVRQVSKPIFQRLPIPRIREIKSQLISQVYQLLILCGLDPKEFFDLMQNEHGVISGSIWLSFLLDDFTPGDMDVFIIQSSQTRKRRAHINGYVFFSELHQYLYEFATGFPSSPLISLNSEEREERTTRVFEVHHDDNSLNEPDIEFKISENYGFCTKRTRKIQIASVYTYVMAKHRFKIQVIEVYNYDNARDFVQESFDSPICMNSFDGQMLSLQALPNTMRKQIYFTPEFLLATMKMTMAQIEHHKKRMTKYTDRGFQIMESLPYGEYQLLPEYQEAIAKFQKMGNDEEEEYVESQNKKQRIN